MPAIPWVRAQEEKSNGEMESDFLNGVMGEVRIIISPGWSVPAEESAALR